MFAFMLIISISGLFIPGDVDFSFNIELGEDAQLLANVAWLITATIFVLMMTPGLSFFYGGMVREKMSSLQCYKVSSRWVSSVYFG